MSDGKAIAQAGHAFLHSWLSSLEIRPDIARRYADLTPGTKITLVSKDALHLQETSDRLTEQGIPNFLVIDKDHIEPPDFDGSEVLTALGVGPLTRAEGKRFLRHFNLWTGGPRMT